MAQRLQPFLCPGSWDARQWLCQRGLFSADCQRKEARRKEERKEIAQGWDHALHLFFPLICSVCVYPGSPHLAKLLRAAVAFTSFLSVCGRWSSLLLSTLRGIGCLWFSPPGKICFSVFLFCDYPVRFSQKEVNKPLSSALLVSYPQHFSIKVGPLVRLVEIGEETC